MKNGLISRRCFSLIERVWTRITAITTKATLAAEILKWQSFFPSLTFFGFPFKYTPCRLYLFKRTLKMITIKDAVENK